jgi:trans-aconitate methyltransferase
MTDNVGSVRAGYDILADEYVSHVFEELHHKPLDRELLDRFAKEAPGPVCDLGCGPGHVARYLHSRGAVVSGIDLSPEMVERARRTRRRPRSEGAQARVETGRRGPFVLSHRERDSPPG